MRPFTDEEWNELPHVTLTSDEEWNPSVMDNDPFSHDNEDSGNMTHKGSAIYVNWCKTSYDAITDEVELVADSHVMEPSVEDYKKYSKYFLNINEDIIKRTFLAITQYARTGWITGDITNT